METLPIALVEVSSGRYMEAFRRQPTDDFNAEVPCPICQGEGRIPAEDFDDQIASMEAMCSVCFEAGQITEFEQRLLSWEKDYAESYHFGYLDWDDPFDEEWIMRVVDACTGEPSILRADQSFMTDAQPPMLHEGEHLEQLRIVNPDRPFHQAQLSWVFAVQDKVDLIEALKSAFLETPSPRPEDPDDDRDEYPDYFECEAGYFEWEWDSGWNDAEWDRVIQDADPGKLADHGVRRLYRSLPIVVHEVDDRDFPFGPSHRELEQRELEQRELEKRELEQYALEQRELERQIKLDQLLDDFDYDDDE